MKQITQNFKTGEMRTEEVPLPLVKKAGVLVRTYFSVISAGTERSTIEVSQKGYIGKARARPEQFKQVLQTVKKVGLKKTYELVMNKLDTPVPLGYSSSGRVIEVGENAAEFQVGDLVACAGAGYAVHAEVVFVPKNLCVKMPEGVSPEEAAYSTLGAIALQGIRQAGARVGERMVVLGLGLIGLLTVQLLKAAGCVVIGLDVDGHAVDKAKESGADHAFNLSRQDVHSALEAITGDVGADAVIITAATRENRPVELAGELCRKKGTVVVVGDVGMKIPRSVYYPKELDFKLSCSYGPGRYDASYEEYGIDYPVGYVRWTEKRNMEAFLRLLKEKKIDLSKITTHRFGFDEALDAYELVTGKRKERFTGILLAYDAEKELDKKKEVIEVRTGVAGKINVGVVGAGSFAQSMILPNVKDYEGVNIEGILVAESHMSRNVAQKFGIAKCYSDPASLFENQDIQAVIIATRHDLHAPYVIQGLKNGKHVYVEKPLAVKESDLREVIEVRRRSQQDILVGFNRRFAPLVEKCAEFFSRRESPMFISYRINAGFLPPDHWTQDAGEGGGRIIGEVCHFMDLCRFLCGEKYQSVFAQNTGDDKMRDNVSVLVRFRGGSLASIHYLSSGDSAFPKERIEIFCQRSVAVIDDFKSLSLVRQGRVTKIKGNQDKGHARQIRLWLESLIQGKPIPVPFEESLDSSVATFMIHESLNKEKMIGFDEYRQRF
jgi:predicted dehydrogenase/threonine dehydrogenase-like Zn-dependent dehydrogenase